MRRWQPIALLAALLVAGCGSDTAGPATTAGTGAARPALATDPAAQGEIVLRGDLSPKTHGPIAFDGRYRVRFEQYDPTNPHVNFADQTPFVVNLEKREGVPAIHLFKDAAKTGSTTKALHGHYWVDVSFGDFPYVVRFTPEG
jgi:hypothetical protein